MDLQLAGTTVLISGSTQGIGFAIAAACLAEGAHVTVNGRTDDGVASAVARLRALSPDGVVAGIRADLSDAGDTAALLDQLQPVDVLVNNLGSFDLAEFATTPDDEWLRYFQVNVMSAVRLSRALLGPMLERDGGRIVFVGTESAVDVPGDMVPYGATKAASLALANGLAKLTRGTRVTVNTVLGGPTYSDGVARTIAQVATAQAMTVDELTGALVRDTSLVGRFLEPREIADVVTFLASPRSSAINGAAVRAEGGVLPTLL